MYPTRASQAVIDRALSVRGGRAELLQAYIDVEPASYNRGFYSVDIRYYYRITAEAFVGGSRPAEISGLAVFDKRVLLFGSEGNAKIFTSRFRPEAGDCQGMGRSNLPEAVVEAVDPIVLSLKLIDPCDFTCPPPIPAIPVRRPLPPAGAARRMSSRRSPPASAPASTATWPSTGAAGGCMSPWGSSPWSGWSGTPSCSSPCTTTACPPGSAPAGTRTGTRIPARSSARSASPWGNSSPPAPCRGWRKRSTAAPAAATTAATADPGRPLSTGRVADPAARPVWQKKGSSPREWRGSSGLKPRVTRRPRPG